MTDRMVVTGIGVLTPTGVGVDEFWSATLAGRSAIAPVERFDTDSYSVQLCGAVTGIDPAAELPGRYLPQTDHMTRLALVAAEWALADAGVDPQTLPEFEMGVVTASSAGGFEFGQRELQKLWGRGNRFVSAYQSYAWFYAVNTGQISIRHGMRGPSGVVVSEQAGGLDALAQARRHLRRDCRLVLAGGVDSNLCPWGWIAQIAGGGLSFGTDPDRAYLPFSEEASGSIPGEGGALLITENAESAELRGARRRYGELTGFGTAFDPAPVSGRPPNLRRAIDRALADAGIGPDDIDVVFADASGVPEHDRVEADALATVFGPSGVPVTAPKAGTGRLSAGAGAVDVVTALLSLRDQVIPPTPNVDRPAPGYGIDLVTGEPRASVLRNALVLARGHGGFNAAAVLGR
ncbi:ketosynthase chain-length factor [Nocardia sp. NPDC020380]|uniref:ketosynthase chain-length factor n=1 Tax=Nocardia sp. NPDC020380 TaxID=3364309 RepID=UPI0037A54474